ncbi:hypothetical protein SUGI_0360480 [Cryptomeria japonica]|nr:hypothetical protein SUGI_0360480 [Cryptomeria japonica]
MIQQEMILGNLRQSTEMEEADKYSYLSDVPLESLFYAGLEKCKLNVTCFNANNKLSLREFISSEHKEGLFRCLKTGIDLLDYFRREYKSDLVSYSRERRLDIWVDLRKLEW